MKFAITLACFLTLGASLTACAAADKIDNRIDCNTICNRYKDCFDKSYDASGCIDRCENHSDDKTAFMNKVDDCDSCIDDKSCSGATFNCAAQCIGVVP